MRRVLPPLLFLLAIAPAGAATIAQHRAVYDLKLIRSTQGASLAGVDGRLAFEVQGSSCDGWTVSFRMVDQFRPSEGDTRIVDTQSTAFESGDGLDMRYAEKEFIDQKLQAETRIKVSRQSTEADGSGDLGEGDPKAFTVPAGAFFPMQHQLKLMTKAEAGETRDTSIIYDGSDGEKVFRAITFIGKRKDAGANQRDKANSQAAPLATVPSWPISISYYPTSGAEQDTPAYQVGFDLYANGVATGLVLDYGDFVLGGDLANLQMLGGGVCQ